MRTLLATMLAALALCPVGLCDMGSIPFKPQAQILEPNQRALIAFNGHEEILILTTDLQADRETRVLEVMPLPSEPKVTKADATIFRRATDLIVRKLPHGNLPRTRRPVTLGGGEEEPAGRVTLRKRIGAHNISVVHLERGEGFIEWVNDYLKSLAVDSPVIPAQLAEVVIEYIRDGFTWFVFDVISLSKEPVTKEAIQIRFASECLYYPLRITRTEHGDTTARFLVLTRELLKADGFVGFPRQRVRLVHPPVTVSGKELRELGDDIHEMLGRPSRAMLRNWEIRGRLSSFKQDLVVRAPEDSRAGPAKRRQRSPPPPRTTPE